MKGGHVGIIGAMIFGAVCGVIAFVVDRLWIPGFLKWYLRAVYVLIALCIVLLLLTAAGC